MVTLPDQRDIKAPLFSLIVVTGEIHPTDGYEAMLEHFGLSEKALAIKDQSGESTFHNRVRWACRALREDGLLERSHGVWRLTERAKQRIALLAQAMVG